MGICPSETRERVWEAYAQLPPAPPQPPGEFYEQSVSVTFFFFFKANQSCHPARQLLSPIAGLQHLQRNLLWAQCWTHKEMPSKSLLKNHHHLNKCSPCPRHYAKSFTNIMPFVADNRQDVNFTEERTETHRCICQRSHTWYVAELGFEATNFSS